MEVWFKFNLFFWIFWESLKSILLRQFMDQLFWQQIFNILVSAGSLNHVRGSRGLRYTHFWRFIGSFWGFCRGIYWGFGHWDFWQQPLLSDPLKISTFNLLKLFCRWTKKFRQNLIFMGSLKFSLKIQAEHAIKLFEMLRKYFLKKRNCVDLGSKWWIFLCMRKGSK